MGDHFVLLVDRLLTESTLEAAIGSQNKAQMEAAAVETEADSTPRQSNHTAEGKLVECRICQDEDEDSNMEVPCSCCGSLKYAHRKCVQRWCNEKGDTVCEICLKQFKPGYTAPPKLFHYGRIPMNFRGNWEISRRDSQNQQFITMVATDRGFVGSPDYDDYSPPSSRSIMFCRIAAVILMVLLILRHFLPIMSGSEQYSVTLLTLLLLRTVGIVLPLYVMLRAVTTFQRRRHLQESYEQSPVASSEGENTGAQLSQSAQTA